MVEGTPQTRLYRFDDFVLDIVAYELRRQGRPVKLALEHLLLGTPLLKAVRRPFVWRPGWLYQLDGGLERRSSALREHTRTMKTPECPPCS